MAVAERNALQLAELIVQYHHAPLWTALAPGDATGSPAPSLQKWLEVMAQIKSHVSAEKLIEACPQPLLILAPFFNSCDSSKLDSILAALPMDDATFAETKRVYDSHFAKLVDHPAFREARAKVVAETPTKSFPSGAVALPGPPRPVIHSVEAMTSSPFLVGKTAPYMPALKILILAEHGKPLWEETLAWGDLVFVAQTLLEQVSEHAEASEDMLRSGKIFTPGKSEWKKTISKLRSTLDALEKAVLVGDDLSAED